jgi:transposase
LRQERPRGNALEKPQERHGKKSKLLELSNDWKGHKALIKRLRKRKKHARVVMEASGVYHLDLALALHDAAHIEVMLLEFVRRMEFQPWCPPTPQELELRTLSRRLRTLTKS